MTKDMKDLVHEGEQIDEINEKLSLIQKKDGLRFSTDAYLLAAFAKPVPRGTMIDLGSGTGVIPLLCLTKDKYSTATAIEIQSEFSSLAERNAELNSLEDRLTSICADVRDIAMLGLTEAADVVTANPPYQKATHGFPSSASIMTAARREENGDIADFCRAASACLKFGGLFYAVYVPDRLADLICALRNASLEPKKLITVYPDAVSKPCLVLIEAKKGAAPSMVQAPPLIIYDSTDKSEKRRYSREMQRIYDTFSLNFMFQ